MTRAVEEKQFDLPYGQLAGRFWPGEGMPILALHGFLDNANSFLPLVEYLPNPLLALDLPGHGLSDPRPAGINYHFLDYVEDVCRLALQLDWPRFHLLGHSLGAGVASFAMTSRMLPVERLMLLDGIGPMSAQGKAAGRTFSKATKKRLGPHGNKPVYATQEAAAESRTKGFGGLSLAASEVLCERGLETCKDGYTWRTDSRLRWPTPMYIEDSQVKSMLSGIQVPTLLLSATKGLGGSGLLKHRYDWVPNLSVQDMQGNHHAHMEHPKAVAAQLLAWLATPADTEASASAGQ